jgi:hypothetical protein
MFRVREKQKGAKNFRTEGLKGLKELTQVRQVSDWGSGAAAYFGWMREAKRENTRCGL